MLQPAARSGSCCCPAPRRMHSSAPASIALAHNVRICNVAACSEKRQLLLAPRRMHFFAPASIALAHNVRICNVAACSEKRQQLLAPRRMHFSAPASIALAHNGEGDSGEASTPEWDKHSSSSLSEVSVACLQDRILQMEEHHYSTSEELQATLAELADLQAQLADAHADNERLADEKQVLLESLCRQTEKLEDSRTKVDTLQELLLREGVEPEVLATGDQHQHLFAVLKTSQEERRGLLAKLEQLETELKETKTALEEKTKENEALVERIR
ncbi:unnamed protein product [Parnassius apollo]|uniref:(apollo) hypothetical protein n=1 Tax=Parnassius apollo TaxID=110799 RepID=A0A8S3Y2F6_PARAO|nr:unnamed protein product [Parnassius apollo]